MSASGITAASKGLSHANPGTRVENTRSWREGQGRSYNATPWTSKNRSLAGEMLNSEEASEVVQELFCPLRLPQLLYQRL